MKFATITVIILQFNFMLSNLPVSASEYNANDTSISSVTKGNVEMTLVNVTQCTQIDGVLAGEENKFVILSLRYRFLKSIGAFSVLPTEQTYLLENRAITYVADPVTDRLNPVFTSFQTAAGMRDVSVRLAFSVPRISNTFEVVNFTPEGLMVLTIPKQIPNIEPKISAKENVPGTLIKVDSTSENLAISLKIYSYILVEKLLDQNAPEGFKYLLVDLDLINKSETMRASLPEVQKAFSLRLNGIDSVELNELSAKCASVFWGPQILKPDETRPVAMIFLVPAVPIKTAKLQLLSSKGPIIMYVIGDMPALPSNYLSGPVRKGQTEIAIESITFEKLFSDKIPPEGWRYLRVKYWFTNLRELQPFETDLSGLVVLVEDDSYVYPSVTRPKKQETPIGEIYLPKEPTAGELVFLVPDETGDLVFVHFTEDGPLELDLTPDIGALAPQKPVAGPVGERSIKLSLFQPRHTVQLDSPKAGYRYIVLDVGLRLNFDSSIASFAFEPTTSLELHDGRGRFYKPEQIDDRLRRPLGPSDLWRDQIVRGEVAFMVPARASSFTLVIPFEAGPTKLPVPETLLSLPTKIIAQKRLSANPSSIENKASKPELPIPKVKETAKGESLSKRTIQEELISKGYEDLVVVVRDGGVAVVIGIAKDNKDIDEVSGIVGSFQEIKEVQIHISTVPAEKLHPLKLKNWALSAMKAVGLNGVQLRMRKKNELILLGTVANDKEQELALSIARILVENVVNLLKKK